MQMWRLRVARVPATPNRLTTPDTIAHADAHRSGLEVAQLRVFRPRVLDDDEVPWIALDPTVGAVIGRPVVRPDHPSVGGREHRLPVTGKVGEPRARLGRRLVLGKPLRRNEVQRVGGITGVGLFLETLDDAPDALEGQ